MQNTDNSQQSEARFRTIYENAPFMIDSFDKNGKAVLWNNACTQQLGYTQEEVNNSADALSLFYPDPKVRDEVMKVILNADGKFREYSVRRKDGTFVSQMWANFSLPDQSVISVGYDISEMRETQEKLRHINQTLEEKVQARTAELDEERSKLVFASKYVALGEMAGGVAHEINNPLAIISGFSQQLGDMLKQPDLDKKNFESVLQSIRSAVSRITKIVSGLRSISRDGSHDPMIVCKVCDLLQEVLSFCRERFHNFGVELIVEGEAMPALVQGRPVQILQVFLNLLNNAFDAVQNLPEKWVKIALADRGNDIEISVIDSGSGISLEDHDRLFKPFYTTKPLGKGTGLGLSISRSIVEAHGGQIFIDAKNPHTCFVVRLPKD